MILSSSTLTHDSVYNRTGEKLGDIKDLMIDTENGRVVYAVLSFGGLLGVGDKLFAIPMDAFEVNTTQERLMLDVTKDRLENAPGFNKDNWPRTPNRTFVDDVYRHWNVPSYYERNTLTTA
jgi:sporulation protein YlmC with PRC-barrel domain